MWVYTSDVYEVEQRRCLVVCRGNRVHVVENQGVGEMKVARTNVDGDDGRERDAYSVQALAFCREGDGPPNLGMDACVSRYPKAAGGNHTDHRHILIGPLRSFLV